MSRAGAEGILTRDIPPPRHSSEEHSHEHHYAFHVGHSTGGGEVARYVARARPGRVAKAVLVSAVPPIMIKSSSNPGGLPIEVFDGLRTALAANRAQFYIDVPTGPFYGFNRPDAKVSQGLIDRWWRQGMMGAANAHYECIKAFSETDFNEDLRTIDVPVLVRMAPTIRSCRTRIQRRWRSSA
jgi:non-heme chloroperoxidase